MIRNHLKFALRNLSRHKGYALINVSGLAVGLACCLLIVLFVRDELSYDTFPKQSDRVYRTPVLFDVFTFLLERGDPETVLDRPFTVALTDPATALRME